MPNHGDDEPAPKLLARHRRSGGAHVGYRRVTGIHRAEGLAGPTRRYLFTVALLAGTSSLPILAAIGSGSATVADGMPPAGITPFIAPPSGGPLVVVPLVPTTPPVVAPGPEGTGGRFLRSGSRPFPVPSGGWLDDAATSGTEPGGPPDDDSDPNGTGGLPVPPVPTPTRGQAVPPSAAPSPSPSPSPESSPSRPVPTPEPSTSAEPGGPPSAGPTGTVEPSPTAPAPSPAPTGTSEAPPSAEPAPSGEPTAAPEPTGPSPTPAPTPAPSPIPASAAGLRLG